MADAAAIITAAFSKIGVSTPTAAHNAAALISLNNLIGMLGAQSLNYSVVEESFAMVVADSDYTIGSGGQWSTVRPIRVISCYLRDGDSYDYPVKVIADKDYYRISNKAFSARPTELRWLPEWPLGRIIFNTSPDYAYTAYFSFEKNFTEFVTASAALSAPNEYKECLVYNLAVSLGEDWSRAIPKTIIVKAEQYKEVLKRLLASTRKVPKAKFDLNGMGVGTDNGYNIVTDEFIDGGAF
jgi:hypothetical protein